MIFVKPDTGFCWILEQVGIARQTFKKISWRKHNYAVLQGSDFPHFMSNQWGLCWGKLWLWWWHGKGVSSSVVMPSTVSSTSKLVAVSSEEPRTAPASPSPVRTEFTDFEPCPAHSRGPVEWPCRLWILPRILAHSPLRRWRLWRQLGAGGAGGLGAPQMLAWVAACLVTWWQAAAGLYHLGACQELRPEAARCLLITLFMWLLSLDVSG